MNTLFRGQYGHELIKSISQAQKSITLAAMVVDTASPMSSVFLELKKALNRNVNITLYVDVFTRLSFYESFHPYRARKDYNALLHQLSRLSQDGASVVWLGKLGANPYKRRFHQKISLIDNETVYFAGGINLTGESFHHHDLMIHTKNTELATLLSSQLQRIAREHYINDEMHKLSHNNTLLIDGGHPHSSVIYDTALEYATKAEDIIYVSQMAPSGKLANILIKKPTAFYLNTPSSMSLLGGTSELINQKRYRFNSTYQGKRYIHAKYMLFTLPNGDRIALTGSHNFSERGVNYGTKEIALLTKDENIWQSLSVYTRKEL